MKTISIPVNNRPDLLVQVLQSIRDCPTWRDWKLVFSCEPPYMVETERMLTVLPNAHISTNSTALGCWANTFHAATIAMALGSNLNLYLEDDYLISKDALAMVDQWARTDYVGVICLRRTHSDQRRDKPELVSELTTGLFGCGFAWRSGPWPALREHWFKLDSRRQYAMWDLSLEDACKSAKVPQWRPMVNRSNGIGLLGTHARGDGKDLNLFGPKYEGEPIKEFHFK